MSFQNIDYPKIRHSKSSSTCGYNTMLDKLGSKWYLLCSLVKEIVRILLTCFVDIRNYAYTLPVKGQEKKYYCRIYL